MGRDHGHCVSGPEQLADSKGDKRIAAHSIAYHKISFSRLYLVLPGVRLFQTYESLALKLGLDILDDMERGRALIDKLTELLRRLQERTTLINWWSQRLWSWGI